MDLEPLYLYILSRLPLRGWEEIESWRKKAGSFEFIYQAEEMKLIEYGFSQNLLKLWAEIKKQYSVTSLFDSMVNTGVSALPYYDEMYPTLLRQIYDPPPVLFYRGLLVDPNEACIGVVGTRMISSYGSVAVPRITSPLLDAGCTIVSGLAYGIDAAAHAEAVKRSKRTIAVLGSGINESSVYPRAHVLFSNEILEFGGLLISEYPPNTPALKHHFVARNRIIAGIALGTCVVECKAKSGALITADYTMDYGRPVYAVPGPIYSAYSEGPNELIKRGAIPVTGGEDILADLGIAVERKSDMDIEFSLQQKRMLKYMQSSPITINTLSEQTKLPTQEIVSILTALELQGIIRNIGAEGYIKL